MNQGYNLDMTRQFSAGGVVFKHQDHQILWLIIKPRPSKDFPKERYGLPKGLIDKGETAEETAVREVWEETGIKGRLLKKIGDAKAFYNFRGEKVFKIISYFLMEYELGEPGENPEVEKIIWLPYPEAHKTLSYSGDKEILKRAAELVELGTQDKLF